MGLLIAWWVAALHINLLIFIWKIYLSIDYNSISCIHGTYNEVVGKFILLCALSFKNVFSYM